jgi:uncharacterized HAD superfamily protein|tara:strand:+ start:130 stop:474 length:345 start_codon:yes stop_codon:yes gene_type:complete
MRYCVDIDGTICTPTIGRDYHKAEPWQDRIKVLNKLYDEGNHIIYFTARAMGRFSGHSHYIASEKAKEVLFDLTKQQLNDWGVKYHELIMGKPHADLFIDDKGINCDDFFNTIK